MSRYVITVTPVDDDGQPSHERSSMQAQIEVTGTEVLVREFTVRAPASTDLGGAVAPIVDLKRLAEAFVPATPAAPPPPRPKDPPPVNPRVAPARPYRRMPDPDSLQRVHAETGSIAGVARHYDVPVHTAQGWIGRLRRIEAAEERG